MKEKPVLFGNAKPTTTTKSKPPTASAAKLATAVASASGSVTDGEAPSGAVPESSKTAATTAKKSTYSEAKTIEEIYQKKTQLEHILLRPDTYIGSVEKHTQPMWVFENGKMVHRNVTFVPGLYKIFDEILVNGRRRLVMH